MMAGQSVIGALRVVLGIDTAAFSNGLKQANSRLAAFGSAVKTGLIGVAAAGVAAVGGLAYAVKGTIDSADEMSKAAKKIGIPIDELSRLKYAADLSGVSFGTLQNGVKRLSKNMNDALRGVGEGAKAFKQLGVEVANADGSLKSSSQVMQEIADKFAAMPDGAQKTALAMDIFGKAGAEMIPMLNGGAKALADLMSEADKFGQVFDQEMGTQAENFNDNMSRISGTLGAIAAQITKALLPYLEKFSEWLVANQPQIVAVANALISVSAGIIKFGADLIGFVQNALQQFKAAWDGISAKIDSVKASVVAFSGDIVAAFKELPAKMLQIGRDIMDGLLNGLKEKWEGVKAWVSSLGESLPEWIKEKLGIHSPSKVMYEIGVNIMQGLTNGMGSMKGGIKQQVTGVAQGVESAFKGIGASITEAIKGTKSWKDVALDALKSVAKFIFSKMSFGGGAFGGVLKGLLGGLFGFASGGSFKVGGSGGVDSQLVAFKASPNERVSVTKPGQMVGGAGVHITFGADIDASGNIAPFVTSVSEQVTAKGMAKVSQGMPLVAQNTTRNQNMRRIAPTQRLVG